MKGSLPLKRTVMPPLNHTQRSSYAIVADDVTTILANAPLSRCG